MRAHNIRPVIRVVLVNLYIMDKRGQSYTGVLRTVPCLGRGPRLRSHLHAR